jgi:hypothetical protein
MQQAFFQEHLKHLEDTARHHTSGSFIGEDGVISGSVSKSSSDNNNWKHVEQCCHQFRYGKKNRMGHTNV